MAPSADGKRVDVVVSAQLARLRAPQNVVCTPRGRGMPGCAAPWPVIARSARHMHPMPAPRVQERIDLPTPDAIRTDVSVRTGHQAGGSLRALKKPTETNVDRPAQAARARIITTILPPAPPNAACAGEDWVWSARGASAPWTSGQWGRRPRVRRGSSSISDARLQVARCRVASRNSAARLCVHLRRSVIAKVIRVVKTSCDHDQLAIHHLPRHWNGNP